MATDRQLRFDVGRLAKSRPGPAGSVVVPASVTRSGVFTYHLADGGVQREYRPPSEVFSADSLASLAYAPVTLLHPPKLVDPENWGDVSCGSVVSQPKQDGVWVVGDLQINKAEVISKVDTGDASETSCGYQCRTEMVSGVTDDGEHYDCIQRNIRYNHVALGPVGWARAGREARLRLDSNSAIQGGQVTTPKTEGKQGMKFRVDGVEYDTTKDSEAAKQAFEQNEKKHKNRLDAKDVEITGLKTKLDAKDAEISDLKKKLDEKPNIPELVKSRVALELRARTFTKFDGIADMSDRDIKVSVIKSVKKDFDEKEKSDDYITGMFESLEAPEKKDSVGPVRELRSQQPSSNNPATPPKPAYQRPLAAGSAR